MPEKDFHQKMAEISISHKIFKDRLQNSLLILREFKQISYLLFPLKSPKTLWFSNDFRRHRN